MASPRLVINPLPAGWLCVQVCFLRKHTVGVLLEALQSLLESPEQIAEMRLSERSVCPPALPSSPHRVSLTWLWCLCGLPSALRDGRCLVEVLERVVSSLDAAMPVAQRVLAIHAHHTGSHRVSTPHPVPPTHPCRIA